MREPPLVSVVMATYAGDRPDDLGRAIESILRQTHERFELIVVKDGPVPPELNAVLGAWTARDERVRTVALPSNTGPAAARNRGFEEASGTYIAVVDADDVSMPVRLERQLAFLVESGADLAGTFLRYVDSAGKVLATKEMPTTPEGIREKMIWFSPVNNPTVMAKAEVLKKMPYDPRFRVAEDYDLWVRLVKAGFTLRNQPEYLYDMQVPAEFWAKRSGMRCFRNDLASRLKAVSLYPVFRRPWCLVLAVGLSMMRLLPKPCLAWVYAARNRMQFRGHAKRKPRS